MARQAHPLAADASADDGSQPGYRFLETVVRPSPAWRCPKGDGGAAAVTSDGFGGPAVRRPGRWLPLSAAPATSSPF
jgi:hypothetical protein